MNNIKIGDRFYKKTTEYSYLDFCKNCGNERGGSDWNKHNNCPSCGTSYMVTTRKVKPVYVLGVGKNYFNEVTLQLTEKKLSDLDINKGYSCWNTTKDKLGVDFFKTKAEAEI